MKRHALGWLADPAGKGEYISGHRMLAGLRAERPEDSGLPALKRASLFQFRGPTGLEQGPIGSCFAFGCVRAFQLYNAAHSVGTDAATAIEASYADLASPRWLYYAARAGEYIGADVDRMPVLDDSGSFPYLGFQQIRDLGFVSWEVCPYPKTADELANAAFIRDVVEKQPAPSAIVSAFDTRGLQTARVGGAGLERVRQVASLLKQRCPVGFGMQVDTEFMRNAGAPIAAIDRMMIQGGHWIQVLAVVRSAASLGMAPTLESLLAHSEETAAADPLDINSLVEWEVIFDNWWGPEWGAGGVGRMSAGLFASSWVSDVTAVRFLPGGK